MHGLGAGRRVCPRQRLGPPAQRGMVRDSEIETEQANDGADQPFGLPQSQAEHGAQRQRRRDRQGRMGGLTTPRGTWLCAPGRHRIFVDRHRQAATLAQGSIIFRPVRYPILLLRNVVTAIGIGLEWHGGHLRGCGWGWHPTIWECSARFAARRGLGGEQHRPATREIPLTERKMVLYAPQPKTLSPADPCNKVARP